MTAGWIADEGDDLDLGEACETLRQVAHGYLNRAKHLGPGSADGRRAARRYHALTLALDYARDGLD